MNFRSRRAGVKGRHGRGVGEEDEEEEEEEEEEGRVTKEEEEGGRPRMRNSP